MYIYVCLFKYTEVCACLMLQPFPICFAKLAQYCIQDRHALEYKVAKMDLHVAFLTLLPSVQMFNWMKPLLRLSQQLRALQQSVQWKIQTLTTRLPAQQSLGCLLRLRLIPCPSHQVSQTLLIMRLVRCAQVKL